MKKIEFVERKSLQIRESGRSSDYITPSFGFGCLLKCSYCYMKRHKPEGLTIAKNYGTLLTAINNHAYFYADTKKPNQTDSKFITYDLACNEDFALHSKHHNWQEIFQFFVDHPIAKATLATKIVPINFLNFNPQKKVRIRFSLMPEKIRKIVEPNTATTLERIKAIDAFIEAGYDIHVNYSPVIVYDNWENDYEELFEMMKDYVEHKNEVLSEVIFLTHNENKHIRNVANNVLGEELLWTPKNQETKKSQYGGKNIRYKRDLKAQYIETFKSIHSRVIPWNTIRYIF
jgi:spore photoproduct lyase